MEGVTLGIAGIASVLVLMSRPVTGLLIYVAALAWYPSYLAVSVGSVDFTVSRIVIMALYAKAFTTPSLVRQFRWCWLDAFIVLALLCEVISGLAMGTDLFRLLENRSGAAFDGTLPYFAVRMIVTSRDVYLLFLKGVLVIAAPLAVFGVVQCLTGYNPLGFMRRYTFSVEGLPDRVLPMRYGLHRAEVTFPMSIMFGLFFAIVGPWCVGLWPFLRQYRTILALGLLLMMLGLVSSVSSGPVSAVMVVLPVMAMFPLRRYWWVFVLLVVLGCVAVDVLSKRHWYYVLAGYGTFDADTAYYRIGLIQEAFGGGMAGHWWFGWGCQWPTGWEHLDTTNHYIAILQLFGLSGLVPFMGAVVCSLRKLREAFVLAGGRADKWLVWCLMSSLVGMLGGMFSVMLFGQPVNFFHMMLGLCGVMPVVVGSSGKAAASLAPVEAPAQHRRAMAAPCRD